MRLKKIKLAGFKSFVDPTTLEFRSPLVAVVGPNGCGKSNIIDAVRWVMGESSAKNLRGESMTDVIFNGSSARKPVGQASIELVFDNTDGTLGGEYASFAEISIRRLTGRDAQSSYFLNGTRCRRRDISEVFMGTGLGPRSYSIIEQGMISRVIEAKPEELRFFLEEAAGISLYRKRRQDTETRMRHTRENLDRLQDLTQELDKQLERLKRQAESADRYKQYKQEQDNLEIEVTTIRWQVWNRKFSERAEEIRVLAVALEEKQAKRTSLELELEKVREMSIEKTDAWKLVQGRFYGLNAEIARLEQTLQHFSERKETLQTDLERTELQYQQNCQQSEEDKVSLETINNDVTTLKPQLDAAEQLVAESNGALAEIQAAMQKWSAQFEEFQSNAEKAQRSAEVEKARIEQQEKQSREVMFRLGRLREEQKLYKTDELEAELQNLEQSLLEKETEGTTWNDRLQQWTNELASIREELALLNKELDVKRGLLQTLHGRKASLEALQQAALGKTNTAVKAWLAAADLQECPRLGEDLVVELGFERAVETVLGHALEAVCVPGLDAVGAVIPDLQSGNLMLLDVSDASSVSNLFASENKATLLATKVRTSLPIQSLLSSVYVVEGLNEALQLRKSLDQHESVVTTEGVWLGRDWLKVYKGSEGNEGVLQRGSELKEIVQEIADLQNQVLSLEENSTRIRESMATKELERETLHRDQQIHALAIKDLAKEVSSERARLEHVRNRLSRIQEEIAELNQKQTLAEEETAVARVHLQEALDDMETFSTRRTAVLAERDKLRSLLQTANLSASESREKAHKLALDYQTLITKQQAISVGLKRLEEQLGESFERRTSLQTALKEMETPSLEARQHLEVVLSQQSTVEAELNQAKDAMDALDQELRGMDKQRSILEQEAESIRTQLEQVRMDWQALEVRAQTVQEKLTTFGVTAEEVLKTLPSDADESVWVERLAQVTKRIERLGAVNLAASQEYETESERKNYLDAQQRDLTEALETLENAIRKIDRETRARFKETFDKVNVEFQKLFPRLFGGGEAKLELMGEDILEAGVTVMARPPGKRNSSIHLLSGGEKALTAVAMVFAIFQLNPAPFCLLDEVDAPLDDANVGRFCDLVKEMSNTVQFVLVTHNKLAMAIAHHLVGVTMKEAGVSRLVSVDVEEAMAMVA